MKPIRELELVQEAMSRIGFGMVRAEPGTMGSGSVEFSDDVTSITIWKDKSIWEFGGEREELEPLGIWRGYPDTNEFIEALTGCAEIRQKAEQGN